MQQQAKRILNNENKLYSMVLLVTNNNAIKQSETFMLYSDRNIIYSSPNQIITVDFKKIQSLILR